MVETVNKRISKELWLRILQHKERLQAEAIRRKQHQQISAVRASQHFANTAITNVDDIARGFGTFRRNWKFK